MLIAGVFFLFYAKASGAFRLAPRMRWPIAAMIVTAVIMPDWLSGSWAADLRLPIALAFVLVGSTAYVGTRRAPIGAVAAIALVLLGVRVWTVTQSWRDADRRFAEFRAASRALPDGARLLVVEVPLTAEQSVIDGVFASPGASRADDVLAYAGARGDRPRRFRPLSILHRLDAAAAEPAQ